MTQEIQKFDVTEATIAELQIQYMPLVINGIEDKDGYKRVREARLSVKACRIAVDKRRKELTADAVKLQRDINSEANHIFSLLEPIEAHLLTQETEYDKEKERIKQEKERLEQIKLSERAKKLLDIGFVFNGYNYSADYTYPGLKFLDFDIPVFSISVQQLKDASDEKFDNEYEHCNSKNEAKQNYLAKETLRQEELQAKIDEEKKAEFERLEAARQERLAKEKEEIRVENERLEKIRIEQKEEHKRLEAIALEQAEKDALQKKHEQELENKMLDLIEQENVEITKSFLCSKQDDNQVNDLLPEEEFSEVEDYKTLEIDNVNQETVLKSEYDILVKFIKKVTLCHSFNRRQNFMLASDAVSLLKKIKEI